MGLYDNIGKTGDLNQDPSWGTYVMSDMAHFNDAEAKMRPFMYRHMEEVSDNPVTQVRHGAALRELPHRNGAALDDETQREIDAAMSKWGMVGLLAVQSGEVVFEKYRAGNTTESRSVIHSCTKSITSTLVAIAIKAGLIDLEAEVANYIPELADADYGSSTIRSLMNMSSGVTEPSDDDDDAARMRRRREAYANPDPAGVVEWLATHRRYAEPSAAYEYVDYNFFLLAETLRRVYGRPYERLLEEQIWVPAGMQHDALARTTVAGDVDGHGGLLTTLRDMARLGLFVLDSFTGTGGPDVPEGWFTDILANASTTDGIRAPGNLPMSPGFGYELGWWPHPEQAVDGSMSEVKCISAQGVFGQSIFIFPERDAVVVCQSASMMHDGACYAATLKVADTLLRASA